MHYRCCHYPALCFAAHVPPPAQQWLARDLAVASSPERRSVAPWIVIATHVPCYCSAVDATTFDSDETEASMANPQAPPYNGCLALGVDVTEAIRKDIEPLMLRYGVDLMAVGHIHK